MLLLRKHNVECIDWSSAIYMEDVDWVHMTKYSAGEIVTLIVDFIGIFLRARKNFVEPVHTFWP